MCFNSNLVFRGILHINEVYRWVQKPIVRHSKGETKTIFNSFEIKQWKLDLKNKVIPWCEALVGDLSLFCHELSCEYSSIFAFFFFFFFKQTLAQHAFKRIDRFVAISYSLTQF